MKKTDSGIPIEPIYTQSNEQTGLPGEYPYTRGIRKDMYRGRLWTMRQYAGFSTAEESNKRYHYLLSQGTTGLSVAFDLPTQIGYDSDHPMSDDHQCHSLNTAGHVCGTGQKARSRP
jgi:methylmalonyl-CoA mutase N-terminal domain/subunit